ncbi:hypothetical protein HW561_10055 [Rhodobacteraceae bacterium B1Z28]|uniref:HEAT repeat domain-containing protein n=1 Tax=Ruegeria haliotis TaxID=2747601 RepID=A0ABX2PPQ4_9RHOB|nr:hypothetical protein [Ruegeria haliotis]NVO56130.1 hypothetical protein [Ruegeria haliotis]
MTRTCVLASLLITMATGAASQEITVRSGEHDGYTRLVFNVPPGTDWVLAQRKNGARLTVAMDDVTYRTGPVFGRLSTNRLASLSQTKPGAALEMEFGCDCVASAFLFQKSMIVVDIEPGTSLPPLIADIPLPVSRQEVQNVQPPKTPAPVAALNLSLLNRNGQGFKDQLSIRLLQGADRHILDLNLAPIGPRSSLTAESTTLPPDLSSNVSLSTVLDDLVGLPRAEFPQIEAKPICFSSAELGFNGWSDARPFPDQVAEFRAGLFHEFDRLDDARVVDLAKLYAFHGFGAEASSVLGLLETQPSDAAWVSTIARVVDERQTIAPNPFGGLQHCNSDAALWAVLTEQALASDARLEVVEQSFARLPDHLRRNLGPRLSSILVDAEELEAARRILRSVDRVERNGHPDVSQAKAEVAEAEGDDTRAEALLTEIIAAPDAAIEAPLALARLVEKRWADRGAVSSQELGLAASYATEFRRSEIGPLMMRTHAIALGLSHEFDTAFDLVRALPQGDDAAGTLNRHLQLLAERSDDVIFLRQTLEMPSDMVDALTIDTAIALSERFASLGFATQTFALANRQHDTTRRSDRARLRARAALMNGRPHQAMLELAEDTSEDAAALRVQAMDAIEDFASAGGMLRDLGDTGAANRYFWLAGLRELIDAEAVGKFADLNETTQALSNPPVRLLDTPLADAANMLRDSEAARQQIAELLKTVRQE